MTRRSVVIELRKEESVQLTLPAAIATLFVTVKLEHKAGQRARLRITADDEVVINRSEPATAKALA